MNAPILPDIVSVDDFADLLGVTPRTVRNYIADGTVTSPQRGKVAIRASIRALIERSSKPKEVSALDKAREAAVRARAEATDQRRRREARDLIDLADAIEAIDLATGVFVSAIESVPARATRDVRDRAALEAAVYAAREDAANRLARLAEDLENGGLGSEQ